MTYRVILARLAKQQMLDNATWWSEHRSADQAARWLDKFEAKLQSLAKNPDRCQLARESSAVGLEVRELHFGLGGKPTTEQSSKLKAMRWWSLRSGIWLKPTSPSKTDPLVVIKCQRGKSVAHKSKLNVRLR